MSETLLWVDVETTGLDPAWNELLEIAVAVSPLSDPFCHKHVYSAQLQLGDHVEWRTDPVVQRMHTSNGLFDACKKNGLRSTRVAEDLIGVIAEHTTPGSTYLAGSSVHFDRAFLARRFPFFVKAVSHRHYDVSAIKLFAQSLGMPVLPKAEAHRAVADIDESVNHARQVAEWFAKMGGVRV